VTDDGLLMIWECVWLLRPRMTERCGYVTRRPGRCPYDHGEPVELVLLTALCLCSGCGVPVEREDNRAKDGKLLCPQCVFDEAGSVNPQHEDCKLCSGTGIYREPVPGTDVQLESTCQCQAPRGSVKG
jgi:hypothetical protein